MNENLDITIICDNYVDKPVLKAMHGFSCLVEYQGVSIILDTGQGGDFVENITQLGIHKYRIDALVLSHGHYDHTGGLKFLNRNNSYKVFAHKNIFTNHLRKQSDGYKKIGIQKENIPENVQFELFDEKMEIFKNIYISGSIIKRYNITRDENLFCEINGSYEKDPFMDEIYVALETKKGLVIFTGCSHAGIENIIEDAEEKFQRDIYGIVGGLHLFRSEMSEIEGVASYINGKNIKKIITGHCTGLEAIGVFKSILGDKVRFSKVGERFSIFTRDNSNI